METFLIKALQLILSLSILVIVHEFGHFIFARIYKVRVEKFYLFFNPWFSLFKFKPKNSETEYASKVLRQQYLCGTFEPPHYSSHAIKVCPYRPL